MRALKYCILGLISEQPLTSQEINQTILDNIGNFWSTKHIQVMPELQRLTKEKLITYNGQKQYMITDEGEQELDNWLIKDQAIDNRAKDIFQMRMYFSSRMSDERVLELLNSQIVQHQAKLKFLEVIFNQRYKTNRPTHKQRGDFFNLKCCIKKENAYIDWLKECYTYIKEDS